MNLLRLLPGAVLHPPVDPGEAVRLMRATGVSLPAAHLDALMDSNGAEVYGGYTRLFGIGSGSGIDAVQWNKPEHWKFAWQGRCDGYWCFAETAWGDQYAYNIERLKAGDERVYYLDAVSMTPDSVAESFEDFYAAELVRQAREPYDRMILAARRTLGDLDANDHLIYTIPIALGGAEDMANARVMPARSLPTKTLSAEPASEWSGIR